MDEKRIHAVTGAFGYTGKYIAKKLISRGQRIITLTNSPDRKHALGQEIPVYPFDFDQPDKLRASLEGVSVLYNTYWVRFNTRTFNHADAIANTETLFHAAQAAGVERIVHVSITNPSKDSPLEYFAGKARLEEALKETGVSYAILRPAVVFGKEDILVNNIAWALRRLPVMGVFGDGRYKLQPIYVEDLADLAVQMGATRENRIVNAIGPETFTYRGLVEDISRIIGKRRPIIGVPPLLGYVAGWLLGKLVNDIMITRDEITGLMNNHLYVDDASTGHTRLTDWAVERRDSLGLRYTSELARRANRDTEYESN